MSLLNLDQGKLATSEGKLGILGKAKQAYQNIKDNSVLGVVKNTITGLPSAAKKVATAVRNTVVKPAAESLVVKPALRTGEAIGQGIASAASKITGNPVYKQRADEYSNRTKEVKVPGAGLLTGGTTKVQKATPRQIVGEGLEAASYLYTPTKAVAAVKGVGGSLLSAGKNIAKGALGGYLGDVGYGLQDQNKTVKEAIKPGLGTVIGAGIPAIGAGITAVRESRKLLNELSPNALQAGKIKNLFHEEAKKYKSAIEFKATQPKVYRGRSKGAYFNPQKMSKDGASFSIDKNVASRFDRGGGFGPETYYISPEAKLLKPTDFPDKYKDNRNLWTDMERTNIQELVDYAKNNGYDGIDLTTIHPEKEIRVINPEILKTSSELTDIYNQATKGSTYALLQPQSRTGIQPQLKQQGLLNQAPSIGEKLPESVSTSQVQPKYPLESSSPTNLSQGFDPVKYVKEQISKREGARTQGSLNILGKAKTFLSDLKAKFVDSTAPIEDTLNKATKKSKVSLLPEDDIHNQIDRVLRSPTLAGQFAKDNGIVDVIQKVDDLDNLDQYLIAKHAIELDTQGITTGRELAKDQELIRAFSPQYEEVAQKVSQYSRKLLDYSVDTGLISKELAESLKVKYPDYVPFNRIFSDIEEHFSGSGGGVASLSRQTAVQKIKGSEREIESPIHSLLSKTNDVFKQGEKNIAAKMLAGYENLPGNPFQLEEIKAMKDVKTGRRISMPGDNAKDTISFFDDGQKRIFKTTPEIAQAAKSLNVQQMNILGKILAFPVRIARLGITGVNLPFVAANVAKDQVSAFINSNNSLRSSIANPVNFTKSLFAALSHNDLYEEMVRAGGAGTSFDIARDQVAQTVSRIRSGRGVLSKVGYVVRHPSELLRAVENIVGRSEEFTRLQQYQGAKQGLLKKGLDQKNAIIEGARAARDNTVNFARKGEWGTVLNSAFLYLNAGIQGTRTLLRNLKTKPISTAAKIATAAMFPVASATAWNLSDPTRKAAYDDIAEYEKENNIIIVPPNPTKDEDGKWNVIKIPLSQEVNSLLGLVRRPLEEAYGLDPVRFGDFAKALIGTVSPIDPTKGSIVSSLTPQAIKPTVEAAVNKNLFTGFPQVPRSLEGLSPENQVKDTTSGTARKIGGLLDVSPIKVEEFTKGTLGGVGSQLLNASDNVLAKAGVIPQDQIGGTSIKEGILGRFTKARGGQAEQRETEEISQLVTNQKDESAVLKRSAESLYKEIKSLPKDQAIERYKEVLKSDPSLAKKLDDVAEEEKLGLTYKDKQIKQLGVENGERAKYIAKKLKELGTKEEMKALYVELYKKKLISKSVEEQITYLMEHPEYIK